MKKYKDWQIYFFIAALFCVLFIISMIFFDADGAVFFIAIAFVAYAIGLTNHKIDK